MKPIKQIAGRRRAQKAAGLKAQSALMDALIASNARVIEQVVLEAKDRATPKAADPASSLQEQIRSEIVAQGQSFLCGFGKRLRSRGGVYFDALHCHCRGRCIRAVLGRHADRAQRQPSGW